MLGLLCYHGQLYRIMWNGSLSECQGFHDTNMVGASTVIQLGIQLRVNITPQVAQHRTPVWRN